MHYNYCNTSIIPQPYIKQKSLEIKSKQKKNKHNIKIILISQ